MIDFKDLNIIDLRPGEPEEIKFSSLKKRKTDEDVEEAMTTPQRMKRSRQMKKMKSRLKMGRQRASRRIAGKEKLEQRAKRQARNAVLKKLTKDVPKSELTFARRAEIEKRLDKMKPRIARIAKKMLPVVRKAELTKRRK